MTRPALELTPDLRVAHGKRWHVRYRNPHGIAVTLGTVERIGPNRAGHRWAATLTPEFGDGVFLGLADRWPTQHEAADALHDRACSKALDALAVAQRSVAALGLGVEA
jgi:hypothetical protein